MFNGPAWLSWPSLIALKCVVVHQKTLDFGMSEEAYEDLCVIGSETEQDAELDDETFGESSRDGTTFEDEFVNWG